MFYLTKEALIETHITNQPPFSLPPPFSSSIPSPLPGWAHRHTFIHNNTHIRTVIIKHTHARVHKRTHRDQPAAICSTCSVQSSQNTLFTTIHHITFPQCHSLVLEKSERERREESRKQNSYCTMKKREIKRFGLLHGTVERRQKTLGFGFKVKQGCQQYLIYFQLLG